MANVDAPRGLIPVRNAGKVVRTSPYTKTAGVEIFQGDLLTRVAAGTISVHAAAGATPIVGVAANYSAAASTADIDVYDDPESLFLIQGDTGTVYAVADNGLNIDIVAGAGSATSKLSGHEADMSTAATTATLPLKVLKLAPAINQEPNDAGINADIIVKINRHEQGNLQTGI